MIVAGVCRKRKKKKRSRNIARPCIIAERVYMVWSIRNDSIGLSCQRCFLCTQKSWISTKPKISLTTKYWLRHLVAFHKWCSYVWYSRFVFTDVTGSVYGNNKYVIIGRIHFDTHISFAVVSLQRFFFRFCYLLLAVSVVESRCRYIACSFHSLQSAAEQRCTSKMPKKTMFVWRKNLIRSPPSSLPSLVHQQHLSVYLFLYISCRLFESPHRIASNMVSFWVHSCVVLSRLNENISRLRHAQTCTYPMCIHTTSIYIHTPVWWPISWQCKGNIHDFGARQRLRRTCFFFPLLLLLNRTNNCFFCRKKGRFFHYRSEKKKRTKHLQAIVQTTDSKQMINFGEHVFATSLLWCHVYSIFSGACFVEHAMHWNDIFYVTTIFVLATNVAHLWGNS